MNRDTGACYWRQTPIRTLLAEVLLLLLMSWVRMNWSSVPAAFFTKDSCVVVLPVPGNVMIAGWPLRTASVQVPVSKGADPPGGTVPIGPTVPFTFCCPVIVTVEPWKTT